MMAGGEYLIGIGVDLVEVYRIQDALHRWGSKFSCRVFLEGERIDCENRAMPWIHYAGRFAVKEAVAKALGTGIGVGAGLSWHDVEVVSACRRGAPSVRFSPEGNKLCSARKVDNVLISLSHARDYAVAQAVLIGCL